MLLRTALINHPVLIIAGVVAAAAAAFGVLSRSVASGEREIERLRKSAKGLIDATVELSEIEAMKKLALETKDAEKLAETYRRELELIETQLIKTKAAIERGEEFTPVVNIRGLVPAETLELIEQEMRRHLEGLKTHADKLGEEAAENFQKKFFETTDITEAIVTSTGGVIMKKIGEELSLAGVDAAHAARMLALAMENLNDKATTQKQKLKDVIDELRGFSDETSKAREALESYYTKLRDQTEVLRAGSELEKKQIKAKQDLREELEQLDPIERAYHTFKMNMMIRLNHVLSEQKDKTEDASDAVEAWVDRLKKEKEQADDTAASLRRMAEERIAGLEANYLQRGLSDKDRFLDDMHLMMEEAGFGMDYIGTELGRFEEMWDAIDLAEKFRDLGRDMGTSFGDAIYGMIDDTMSLKEAAQSVAQDISRAFYDAFVTRFLEDMMADFMANMVGGEGVRSAMQINAATTSASILTTAGTVLAASMVTGATQAAAILSASGGGGLGTLVAKGGVFSHGSITPFARGGIFREPTVFSMPHGLGVAGEAGDEAAVPLKRMKSGNLGVETDGGGGGRYNFVININGVTDANSFRRSRTQIQNDLRDAVRRSRV